MANVDVRVEAWKKRLLDLGKRNRLINFKETKRSNLKINFPDYKELFNAIVEKEQKLTFSYPLKTTYDENGEEENISIQKGDLGTNRPLNDQQKTLKALRSKAKTSIEEQGINSLYLTFGMIKWKEIEKSDVWITSPIVLVPTILTVESIKDPFVLQVHEDEIVINPSLAFKFENDFGITFPEFNPESDIEEYLSQIKEIADKNSWEITTDANLTLLSFLKINMYKDLEENLDKLASNDVVKALAGDKSGVTTIPNELNDFNHDKNVRPVELFQVVDADSSQQDAVLLSKNGVSFVLQGPPGTGKSQTITNIIAESMAEGKKVLFVSEKAAALDVVKNRLTQVGLDNFCLTLHSHKANKKEILAQLNKTLDSERIKVRDDALYKLSELEEKRNKLTEYSNQLHAICEPLNISLYSASGHLSKLLNTQNLIFEIDDVGNVDSERLNKFKYLLTELSKTIGNLSEDYYGNPWYGCVVPSVSHELRHDIEVTIKKLNEELKALIDFWGYFYEITNTNLEPNVKNILDVLKAIQFYSESKDFPEQWLDEDISSLKEIAMKLLNDTDERNENIANILTKYKSEIFSLDANRLQENIESNLVEVQGYLNSTNYCDFDRVISKAESILTETNTLKKDIEEIHNKATDVSTYLKIGKFETFKSLQELKVILELILDGAEAKREWFEIGRIEKGKLLLSEAIEKNSDYNTNLHGVQKTFSEKIFEVNVNDEASIIKSDCSLNKVLGLYNKIDNPKQIKVNEFYSFADNEIPTLKSYSQKISSAIEKFDVLSEQLALNAPKTISEMYSLKKLLSLIMQNPKPTKIWFDDSKETMIEKVIADIKLNISQIEDEKNDIFTKFHKDILNIDCKSMLSRFNTEYNGIFKILKKTYRQDKNNIIAHQKSSGNKMTDEEIKLILNKIVSIKEKEEWLEENENLAKEVLGNSYSGIYTSWDLVEENRLNFKTIKNHFGTIMPELEALLISTDISGIAPSVSTICELGDEDFDFIKKIFDDSIVNLSLNDMELCVNDLIGDADKTRVGLDLLLNSAVSDVDFKKMNFEEVIQSLEQLNNLKISEEWFAGRSSDLENHFGKFYTGINTNWDELANKIDTVSKITDFYKDSHVPNELINYLTNEDNLNEKLKDILEKISYLGNVKASSRVDCLLSDSDVEEISFEILSGKLGTVTELVESIFENYLDITKCSDETFLISDLIQDIKILDMIQSFEKRIEVESEELHNAFDYKYQKLDTNWHEIVEILEYVNELISIKSNYGFSNELLNKISSDEKFKNDLRNTCVEKQSQINEFKIDFNFYVDLFDNKDEFNNMNFYKLLDRLDRSVGDLTLLEEWIDFRSIREECKNIGLGEFIGKVEELKMNPDIILNTFLKRFYRLWIDSKIESYPAVNSFRSRTHESMIKDFRNLDKEQFAIAKYRILERLIAKLPDSNYATSAFDEVGILKRELAKQRKLMPLRRLFANIPNLLMTLKPCLMMSPLSVSLYLKADGYKFDLVIFDEASQVFTEDAIGAIMRGKQVIIAGDSKQLPPTSFFSSSISDGDDFDSESEEEFDDVGAFDSVLEEAANALPERTLKWHYRSRHEHLIAFSNAKIYDNKLITFPSNLERVKDNGVEYVYVENGVYDRGGKKNNINEANRVAMLVFEHFKKFPNRSLGVIAFSEAQKQAVDNALEKLRLKHIEFERFFDENIEQPFFTKNIETVQGDERDTIIFSIGYAKDQNGQMYMNFGPLTKNGGHRRLNVAITRAKYNVKLVGSIQPTDIRLENTNSLGATLLRRYIEFAINGDSVLYNELKVNDNIVLESPFEESVYDFLTKHGYNVKTQVGCSGYRIDMAIKHPTLDGIFVLGIECDGATYHSSRTARERDRLRQTILEDIGWKIYRIWSTDWIKDTKTEGEKLLSAINKAIEYYSTDNFSNESPQIEVSEFEEDIIEIRKDDNPLTGSNVGINADNPYNFNYYAETEILDVERISNDRQYTANVIEYVVGKEHPIHFELLCKRIAPLFGNQKATVKVRNYAEYTLKMYLADKVEVRNDFCYYSQASDIKVKIPNKYGDARTINYISTEEIAEAMIKLIENSFGIEKGNLCTLTARTFGFNRTGANVVNAMETACAYLLDTNKVREVDGKLII